MTLAPQGDRLGRPWSLRYVPLMLYMLLQSIYLGKVKVWRAVGCGSDQLAVLQPGLPT